LTALFQTRESKQENSSLGTQPHQGSCPQCLKYQAADDEEDEEDDGEDSYAKYCEDGEDKDFECDSKFLAIIEYSINTEGEAFIDITLDDFSPESIDKLARIFAAIPTVNFQLKSLQMIEDVFLSEGKDSEFKTFINKTMSVSKEISKLQEETGEDTNGQDSEPIVCPTKLTL
jgi:hypothetical protein